MSSAGAGIGTGSDFQLNRQRTGELLGFDGICENVRDANAGRDFVIEALSAITILMTNIGWATDTIFLFCSNEFGFVEIADRYCGSSSIMPQKKNPHSLMEVAELATQLSGALAATFANARSISGSIKSVLQNFDKTAEAISIWAGIISTLHVNRETMRRACTEHWALATDIAGAIVRETQLPWRTAHQITAILVRTALEQNKKPADIDSKFLDIAAREYIGEPLNVREEALREVLDPLRAVKARTLFGGTAPDEVKRQITKSRTVLAREREALSNRRARLIQAAGKLEAAIDNLLAGQ